MPANLLAIPVVLPRQAVRGRLDRQTGLARPRAAIAVLLVAVASLMLGIRGLSRHQALAVWGRSLVVLITAVLAVHLSSSNAAAQQRRTLSPSPAHVPATTPPKQDQSIRVAPAATTRGGIQSTANNRQQHNRPRAVDREVARRVAIAGGVLVLPVVAYYGVPIILNVPELGYVELPEERYAELYDKLSSADPEQVQDAIAALKEIKAAEDAQIEAIQRGVVNVPSPTDDDAPTVVERDLSEPISFGRLPSKFQTRRHPRASRGLY